MTRAARALSEEFDANGGRDLLDAVRALRPELEATTRRAEEERTLPGNIVERFRELGIFWLKTPAELGGRPLHPLAFSDLVEEIAYLDPYAGWAAMIGCGSTGIAARLLADEGIVRVFVRGRPLPILAGQPHPRGSAVRVGGGYVVSGRWSFASGINHADWVLGGARVVGESPEVHGSEFGFVAPKSDATVHDNWFVAGLEGTGSSDYSLEEVFVPVDLTYDRRDLRSKRGGCALFHQQGVAFVANEVPPFAVGVANRAIDDMVDLVAGFERARGTTLSDRGAFHKEVGYARARVDAVRLYYREAMDGAFEAARAGTPIPTAVDHATLMAQTLVAETCFEVTSTLFRYGGGRVLALSSPMQRHVRSLLAARQHIAATEENYEIVGRAIIEERLGRATSSGLG